MRFKVDAVNHVGVVVRDEAAAEAFYIGVLGFTRHHRVPSWLVVNPRLCLHLIEIPEAELDAENLFHAVNHVALQVDSLAALLSVLLEHGREPFQMDFDGNERQVTDASDSMEFGLGTLFVRDNDGNLLEFLQEGRGLFTVEMRPQVG